MKNIFIIRNEILVFLYALAIVVGTPILDEFDATGFTRGLEIYSIVTPTYLWRISVFLFVGAMVCLRVTRQTLTRGPAYPQASGLNLCWFMYISLALSSILSFSNYFDLAISYYRILEWFIALTTVQLLISKKNRHGIDIFFHFLRIAPIISLVVLALVWIYNPSLTYSISASGHSRLGGIAMHPNGLGLLLGLAAR